MIVNARKSCEQECWVIEALEMTVYTKYMVVSTGSTTENWTFNTASWRRCFREQTRHSVKDKTGEWRMTEDEREHMDEK